MKNINIMAFLLGIVLIYACEKDETKTYISDNPVRSTLQTYPSFAGFSLDSASKSLSFEWTATDFGFSASVNYTLQIDSAGKNFANPINVLTANALSAATTVGDFNKAMLDAGYDAYDSEYSMEMRIKASVSPLTAPAYSDTVDFNVVLYATVFPPIYMCGEATGGWDWTKGVEMRSSAPKVYQTVAHFTSGGAFRFFAQADWNPTSYNYPYFNGGTIDPKLENAADGDQNFRFTGTTGYYDITVDLKTLTITMDEVNEPVMYMTGAALGGWDWTDHFVQMTWISNGMFEATAEFINGEAFRFFGQADWNPDSYSYPYFSGGSIDSKLANAGDSDNNFKFTGTTGTYKIKLNMLDKIITMTSAE